MGADKAVSDSVFIWEPMPSLTFENVSERKGYTDLLRGFLPDPELDSFFKLDTHQVIALCGRPGCGKRTLAYAFAGTSAQLGTKCLRLSAAPYPGGIRDTRAQLHELLAEAGRNQAVVIIESCGKRYVWEALAREAELHAPGDMPTCILIEDDEHFLSSPWMRNMLTVRVLPPDTDEREDFFSRKENAMMRMKDMDGNFYPTYRWLGENSEGLTYNDMKQVICRLRTQLKCIAVREYGGKKSEVFSAWKEGKFFYTKSMFMDSVRMVRQNRRPQTAESYDEPYDTPDEKPAAPEEGLKTEDEAILAELFARLSPPV